MSNDNLGLYDKYHVERRDGRSAPGEKHDGCRYFVLDMTHDPFALPAIAAYAAACEDKHKKLADDLINWAKDQKIGGRTPLMMINLSCSDDEPDEVGVSVNFLQGVKVGAMIRLVQTAAHGMLSAAARIMAIKYGCSEEKAMAVLTGDANMEDIDENDGDED